MIVLFNKPFNVLCQFSDKDERQTLADFISIKRVYAAGRLDYDSEGLVILTDDGKLQNLISDPKHKLLKTYWVQVEGKPDEIALSRLRQGIVLNDFRTKPAQAFLMDEPCHLWQRTPPVRYRKYIATAWMSLILSEGKNRQVRRMTAAVSLPTLRLIRYAIGKYSLQGIAPGEWRILNNSVLER